MKYRNILKLILGAILASLVSCSGIISESQKRQIVLEALQATSTVISAGVKQGIVAYDQGKSFKEVQTAALKGSADSIKSQIETVLPSDPAPASLLPTVPAPSGK